MIGDLVIVGKDTYVKSNKEGTLEVLPKIRWYRTLHIYFMNYFKVLSIGEVRDFYKRYKIK